ncbi:Acidic mammalian chitinase [Halotydeus destructor]|nr:Acidic mammalian chitinase [Halotydeus destructor]
MCSHLVVGYAYIGKSDLVVPEDIEEDIERYRQLTSLKLKNNDLKIILSVADKGHGSSFSRMSSSRLGRKKFVNSLLDLVEIYNFDGVEIDWEFPAWKGLPVYDKSNFIYLFQAIRKVSKKRKMGDLLISAAVATPVAVVSASYDIPQLADYDYHSFRKDRPYTGHHSPLYPRPQERDYFATLNIAWAAAYWANTGMPIKKINIGVPSFARTYNLAFAHGHGLDVPTQGPGLGQGRLNYTQVCKFLDANATKEFDFYSQVPFAYKDYDWIAYENERSLMIKSRFVSKFNLGGVALYALNYDDWAGSCTGKPFPLQRSISRTLELASIKSYRKYVNDETELTPSASSNLVEVKSS